MATIRIRMAGDAEAKNGALCVSPLDRRGRAIDSEVLGAAEGIVTRAIAYAEKLRIDPAIAADILEEAAAIVSRTVKRLGSADSIRDLESYLFRSFLRRLNRKYQGDFANALDLQEHFLHASSIDALQFLDNKLLMDELLARCDPFTRELLCRRIEGYSWTEIARMYNISSHVLQLRFTQTVKKLRKKLGFP